MIESIARLNVVQALAPWQRARFQKSAEMPAFRGFPGDSPIEMEWRISQSTIVGDYRKNGRIIESAYKTLSR